MRRAPSAPGRRAAGFTLVELMIVLAVTVVLVLVLLRAFDGLNRFARVQTNLSALQQQQRVAQNELTSILRMTGRGGLAGDPIAAPGVDRAVHRLTAVEVRNNVGVGGNPPAEPVVGGAASAVVGSDVLIVRGVFSTPVYQIDYVDAAAFIRGGTQVVVRSSTPTGLPQDLAPLRRAIDERRPEALVFTDALGDGYGVAELNFDASSHDAQSVTLAFRTSGGTHAALYAPLSVGGAFPDFRKILSVGILEEYRYYVSEGPVSRQLACARVYPGTEVVHDDGVIDELVARDIFDLQVALAYDSHQGGGFLACDGDFTGADDDIVESADGAGDDWLFNGGASTAAGEDPEVAPWTEPGGGWATTTGCGDPVRPRLFYVRINTLALSPRADPYYDAEPVAAIEDRPYGTAADDPLNGDVARRFRRRILQTTLDLRNL